DKRGLDRAVVAQPLAQQFGPRVVLRSLEGSFDTGKRFPRHDAGKLAERARGDLGPELLFKCLRTGPVVTHAGLEERLPLRLWKNDPLLDPVQELARIPRRISFPGALQLGLKVGKNFRGKPRTQVGRKGKLPDKLASQGCSAC